MARDAVPKEERKANRRGAARLAAVQALYQMDIAGSGLNDILAEFESHWIGREVEGAQYLPAEAFFATWYGRRARATQHRPVGRRGLARGWPLKRIETIPGVVLRAGAYELGHAATRWRAWSSPYVDVAHASSTRTRPAWSMPCLTSWRAIFARTSLIVRGDDDLYRGIDGFFPAIFSANHCFHAAVS
jgi:N utilization substance protein B